MVSLDLASAFKFQKINNLLKSYRLTSQNQEKMSLLPSTEIKGGRKSRVQEIPNGKPQDLLPTSKIKASKKKNKKSFLSFITTLAGELRKLFLILFKIERVSRRYPHELRWYLLSLDFHFNDAFSCFFTNCYVIGRSIKSLSLNLTPGPFISVIHQDFVAFID